MGNGGREPSQQCNDGYGSEALAGGQTDTRGFPGLHCIKEREPRNPCPGFPQKQSACLHPANLGKIPGQLWNAWSGRDRFRPTPLGEQPIPLFRALQSYLSIVDVNVTPEAVSCRGQQAAEEAAEYLVVASTRMWNSPIAGRLVRWLVRRVRILAGVRESPKFLIIRLMSMVRAALLASGRELAATGVVQQAEDHFFLRLDELKVLAMCTAGDWKKQIASRRAVHKSERRRRPIPRLLLSDGTATFQGLVSSPKAAEGTIVGSGVSSGTVEGTVHGVFDPNHAQLQPGEILVCLGTDPSWTPLFLAAGGLVMEVGGMMTHGSVVAREYGIPAVVGVDRSTERLQTGQRIRVDGNSGQIQLIA